MKKTCFVISVIGNQNSEQRKYADRLFKHLIEPCAKETGYTSVRRADHIDETGMITVQVVEAILNADLVIADLTHPNPNVCYELAIRHSTGKRLVQLVQGGVSLPFDVAQVRSVQFQLDLDSIEEAKQDLLKKIQAAEKDDGPVTNPITQSKEVNALKSGTDTTARLLGHILETQSSLGSNIANIQSDLAFLMSATATSAFGRPQYGLPLSQVSVGTGVWPQAIDRGLEAALRTRRQALDTATGRDETGISDTHSDRWRAAPSPRRTKRTRNED